MRILLNIVFLLVVCAFTTDVVSQPVRYTQTVRGAVIDIQTQAPLTGANIVVLNTDPVMGTTSDANGSFRLEKVPVGRQSLKIMYLGYESVSINEIEITSAKEVVLTIRMTEKVMTGQEVTVTAQKTKAGTVNEMTPISARTFSVEETGKYAGSWGDPARMASKFAGVTAVSDERNDIVVRGNSPIGVLWRLNGIEIPNPNHFAVAGSSGGAISMINNNLLDNSDFLTGAFSAEYGNALAAVFDLKMRTGNNEKREYIFQMGINGFELGCEGPFIKGKRSSYLVNYRYSTLAVLDKIGISIIDAVPKFQDLSFNFNFPMKNGAVTFFGVGGKSKADSEIEKDSTKWENRFEQYGFVSGSQMGIAGLSYSRILNNKSYLKIIYSSSVNNPFNIDDSTGFDYQEHELRKTSMIEGKNILSAQYNLKQSVKSKLRFGAILDNIYIDNNTNYYTYNPDKTEHRINTFKGDLWLLKAYAQWKMDFTSNLSLNSGVHGMYLFLNEKYSIEPRIALNWIIDPVQTLSLGYGIHRQLQPTVIYFAELRDSSGNVLYPNKELGFTQNMHYVLSYNYQFTEQFRTKMEVYYQHITDAPVRTDVPTASLLNFGTDDNIFAGGGYTNKGKGENYGIEATIERFFHRGYYYLLTASVYDSYYYDGNGKKRNTRYNCNFAYNLLAGKEFKIRTNNIIGIHITLVHIGGQHYTPIDLNASRMAGTEVYIDSLAYSNKYPDFFKIDLRIRYRYNRPKCSHELAFELGNALDHKNVNRQYYDPLSGELKYSYLLSRIPLVAYRLEF